MTVEEIFTALEGKFDVKRETLDKWGVTAVIAAPYLHNAVQFLKEESGIKYYVKELESKGFKAILLPFKSGSTAVCVEGTDDLETARAQMKTLRMAGIDAWIYTSKQNLHTTK